MRVITLKKKKKKKKKTKKKKKKKKKKIHETNMGQILKCIIFTTYS